MGLTRYSTGVRLVTVVKTALSWKVKRLIHWSLLTANCATLGGAPPPYGYKVIDLGPHSSVGFSEMRLNGQNQVLDVTGNRIYSNGVWIPVTIPGASHSKSYGMNDLGQVVGDYTAGGSLRGFIWTNGSIQNINPITTPYGVDSATVGQAINNYSVAVGVSLIEVVSGPNGIYGNGILVAGGVSSPTPRLPNGKPNHGHHLNGINNRNQIVGTGVTSDLLFEAFVVDQGGQIQPFRPVGGFTNSTGVAINESSAIMGELYGGAVGQAVFLYTGGEPQIIGSFGGGSTYGRGFNNHNEIVGFSNDATGLSHGFIYSEGVLHDLNSLVPSAGGTKFIPHAINDSGVIAATTSESRIVLLTPLNTPEPPVEVNLSPGSDSVPAGETSSRTITVTASPNDYRWTAATSETWIIIVGGSGIGSGTITYRVSPNPSVRARSGLISVSGTLFEVRQAGMPGTISLSTTGDSVPAGGATQMRILVSANPFDYTWLAASRVSWIRITSGFSGTGNGIVTYDVVANPAPTSRQGTILIGADTTFTVQQAGFSVPPKINTPLRFVAVTPCRVADTRVGQGKIGAFGPPTIQGGHIREIPIPSSVCGVPSSAAAYSLNFTVVPAGPLSYLTTWPTGVSQPLVSTLNSFDGRILANAAIVPAGTNGAINIYVTDRTDVIVDINGYFVP